MKKSKLLGLTFIALASITSCTNDMEVFSEQINEIKLTSKISPTRVSSLDYQSTQIVEGQKVGVTITGARSEHRNIAWYVGAYGELSNTGDPVYWAKGDATITAYHPYNTTWSSTSHEFSVNTDQCDEVNYRNSDLLWATVTSSITENAIPLIFSHSLAKINITLRSADIENLSGATIYVCGTNTATTFNPSNGTLSASTFKAADIKAGVTTSSSYTASAIVIPQTIASGTKFITVEHGGKAFHYTLTADKELKAGYSHNYTLTVNENKTEIDLCSDNITDWKDDNNTGYAEEEVETVPNNQIWYTSSNGTVVTPISTTNSYGNTVASNVYEDGKGIITFSGGDLRSIGNSAFTGCSTLTSITLPNCVTHIENGAFASCSSLASINLPNSITNIQEGAFINCSALTNITIPRNVTRIEDNAFTGCTSLTRVDIKASTPPTIFNATFGTDNMNLKIYVPARNIDAYKAADYWKELNILAQ